MKAALVVVALLVVGSNAFLFESLGPQIDQLKQVGTALVSGLVEKGKQVLTDLLGKAGEALQNFQIGKRDADTWQAKVDAWKAKAAEWRKDMADKLDAHKAGTTGAFSGALNKLKALHQQWLSKHPNFKTLTDFHKAVDTTVAKHDEDQEVTKRFFVQDIKDAAQSALDLAKAAATSDAAKALALQAAQAAVAAAIGRRSIIDDVKGFFAPHVATLTDAVSGIGSTLKGHATNLWNAIKDQVTALGQKLSGHVDKLKEHGSTLLDHGKNALDALKSAVGDVLSQTLKNATPALNGIIKTGTDAAGVVANHVAGAVSGSN